MSRKQDYKPRRVAPGSISNARQGIVTWGRHLAHDLTTAVEVIRDYPELECEEDRENLAIAVGDAFLDLHELIVEIEKLMAGVADLSGWDPAGYQAPREKGTASNEKTIPRRLWGRRHAPRP